MIIQPFPQAPTDYNGPFIQRVLETVRTSFSRVVGKDEAVSRVLLLSSGGNVFAVTVTDAGALTTTQVDLASR